MGNPSHEECARECAAAGFEYMGVEFNNQCFCGNTLPSQGLAESQDNFEEGGYRDCGIRGDACGNGVQDCGGAVAVFAVSGRCAGCWDGW